MKQKREDAFEKVKKRLEDEAAQKAETKRLNEKLAINEMMKVSKKYHKYIVKKANIFISDFRKKLLSLTLTSHGMCDMN